MDITKFTEDLSENKEYKHRVLVYPNITYQQNLERDSYVVVIREVLKYMVRTRPDVYWILIVPEIVKSLSLPNTEQRILPMPTYPNTMRTHFDASAFLKLINWRDEDIDVVYSHLPEHTAQISNVFNNSTNISPNIVGYCHWYETPANTAYEKTMLWSNIAGMLEMIECGVNSEWLKSFILSYLIDGAEMISKFVYDRLDKIVQPHYLGIDSIDTEFQLIENKPTKVVFNHRDNEYTGWNWFVQAMDKMWDKRQDFIVYTTLTQIDRPWNQRVNLSRREQYLDFLKSCHFGVGCFEKYSAWSISTTDGLSRGTPYLLPDHLCYPEMLGSNYPLFYTNGLNFMTKFEALLDSDVLRRKAYSYLNGYLPSMMWSARIAQWFDGWNNVFVLKRVGETPVINRIVEFIKKKKSVTKRQITDYLNWGVNIKWSGYRNALRENLNVRFTKNRYEWRE